jgi:hypothetical protein
VIRCKCQLKITNSNLHVVFQYYLINNNLKRSFAKYYPVTNITLYTDQARKYIGQGTVAYMFAILLQQKTTGRHQHCINSRDTTSSLRTRGLVHEELVCHHLKSTHSNKRIRKQSKNSY